MIRMSLPISREVIEHDRGVVYEKAIDDLRVTREILFNIYRQACTVAAGDVGSLGCCTRMQNRLSQIDEDVRYFREQLKKSTTGARA